MERMGTQTHVTMFRPLELQVLVSGPRFVERQSFEFRLGNRLVQKLGSFTEGSRNPTT